APVSAVQAPRSPSPLMVPTAAPSVVPPTEPPAAAPIDATATPPPATPTAIAGERLAPPEETRALAAAAPGAAERGGPAPVVVPPSARLVRGLTPTPNVVASSPMLAPGAAVVGSADYPGAIKRVQDARKAPTAPRLEDRIQAALDRARAGG